MKKLIKIFIKNIFTGLSISIGLVGGVFFLAKAAGLTATSGSPLTASNWNNMVSNFFWGSGTGGIFYNGKVGIGVNSPNKALHIYDTTNNAEIDIQSVEGVGKHWGIYQDASSQQLKLRNQSDKIIISTGGALNAIGGLCINGDCKTSWSQVIGGGVANYTGTCDLAHKGSTGIMNGYYKFCDGTNWYNIKFIGNGTSSNPGLSCFQIKTDYPSYINGYYYIIVSGATKKVYCDMSNGGRTLVARTIATNNYNVTSAMGTLTTYNQTSGSWKLSDTDINAIPKENGYKFSCGTEARAATFSKNCVFGSTTIATNGDCNTYSNHENNRYGVTNYPTGNPGIIYYSVSLYGCYGNGNWHKDGRLRVK